VRGSNSFIMKTFVLLLIAKCILAHDTAKASGALAPVPGVVSNLIQTAFNAPGANLGGLVDNPPPLGDVISTRAIACIREVIDVYGKAAWGSAVKFSDGVITDAPLSYAAFIHCKLRQNGHTDAEHKVSSVASADNSSPFPEKDKCQEYLKQCEGVQLTGKPNVHAQQPVTADPAKLALYPIAAVTHAIQLDECISKKHDDAGYYNKYFGVNHEGFSRPFIVAHDTAAYSPR